MTTSTVFYAYPCQARLEANESYDLVDVQPVKQASYAPLGYISAS